MNRTDPHADKLALAGTRIGIFGKGGSGKSTVVVLLARALRKRGYEVCLLDADSTNIGLPLVLEIAQPPAPLMEYFGGTVFSGGQVTCPVDDPTQLPGGEIYLEKLPARYLARSPAGITLLIAGKIGDQGPGAGCDGPVSKIARDLKVNRQQGESPVTLVDFKAGFEDTARGVITSLDWAVVVVDPTIAAIEMAENMRATVDQIKNGHLPATRHLESQELVAAANKLYREARIKGVLFLLNKVGDAETETYMRQKLAERGIEPAGVITFDPVVPVAWLKGTRLEVGQLQGPILRFLEELEIAESRYTSRAEIKAH